MRRAVVWAWVAGISAAGCARGASDLESSSYSAEEGRCFVAFVHGRGDDQTGWSQEELERHWAPDVDRDGAPDRRYSLTAWAAEERGCEVLRVGYDGHQAFWDEGAAGEVATRIGAWIGERAIGQGELVIITHSMGGLVARWIVDQGVPRSPYFDARYQRVADATSSVITIQAPHAGTEVADALFGEADTWYARRVADVVTATGIDEGDPAARWMRRIEMEHASASGSWMGDAARTVPIRTVAGFSTFDGAGTWSRWMDEDYLLAIVWGSICHRSHAINAYLCREDEGEAGDGLVEEVSGAGQLMRGGAHDDRAWDAGQPMQGAREDWLRIEHNHHQGRYDRLAAEIRDRRTGASTRAWLGSYLGDHIHEM